MQLIKTVDFDQKTKINRLGGTDGNNNTYKHDRF